MDIDEWVKEETKTDPIIVERRQSDGWLHIDWLSIYNSRSARDNNGWKIMGYFTSYEDAEKMCELLDEDTTYESLRKVPNKLRFQTFKRDKYRCVICGRSSPDGARLEADHIIPFSKGGKTVLSNLQTLCKTCNSGKSDSYL